MQQDIWIICLVVAFAISIKAITAHYKLTIPSLLVRGLFWWARWWTNLAIQYDAFLFAWREYKKAHPIVPRNETVVVEAPKPAASPEALRIWQESVPEPHKYLHSV